MADDTTQAEATETEAKPRRITDPKTTEEAREITGFNTSQANESYAAWLANNVNPELASKIHIPNADEVSVYIGFYRAWQGSPERAAEKEELRKAAEVANEQKAKEREERKAQRAAEAEAKKAEKERKAAEKAAKEAEGGEDLEGVDAEGDGEIKATRKKRRPRPKDDEAAEAAENAEPVEAGAL